MSLISGDPISMFTASNLGPNDPSWFQHLIFVVSFGSCGYRNFSALNWPLFGLCMQSCIPSDSNLLKFSYGLVLCFRFGDRTNKQKNQQYLCNTSQNNNWEGVLAYLVIVVQLPFVCGVSSPSL